MTNKIKVLVNGYGVIGKRVADAVMLQNDMELVGVADVSADYRVKLAGRKGYPVYASVESAIKNMETNAIKVSGTLQDIIEDVDVVIDATPKGIGSKNKHIYDKAGIKSIFQGGENHELTGVSFVAQANYKEALGKQSVRCVSCNTTGLTRIIDALNKHKLVKKVRASLFRRGTDPWESHANGMINTVVPEKDIPSHQGPDVKTVLSNIDITTIAAAGPFNLSHLHTLFIETNRPVSRKEIIDIYAHTPRIAFVKKSDGIAGLNSTIELMRDLGRPRNDMWEVALWEDVLEVNENELMLVYQVHNEAVVVPENIDAVRALMATEPDATSSIEKTNVSMGITRMFL